MKILSCRVDHGRILNHLLKNKEILISSLIALTFFIISASNWDLTVSTHHFMMRDFLRSQKLLEGEFIWFGPELNFGGYLPGPAYYYLLAFAQLFSSSVLSIIYLEFALFSISLGLICYYLLRESGLVACLFYLLLTIDSNIVNNELARVWNPSFLFIFNSICAISLFKSIKERNIRFVYLSSFLIGVAIQLHLSALLHGVTLFFSLYIIFKGRAGKGKVVRETLTAFCFFIAPLVPYLVWFTLKFDYSAIQAMFVSQTQFAPSLVSVSLFMNKGLPRLFEANWIILTSVAISFTYLAVVKKLLFLEHPFLKSAFYLFLLHLVFNFTLSYGHGRYLLVFLIYTHIFYSLLVAEFVRKATAKGDKPFRVVAYSALMLAYVLSYFIIYWREVESFKRMRSKPSYTLDLIRTNYWTHLLSDYFKIVKDVYAETQWEPEVFNERIYHFVSSSFEVGTLYQHLYDEREDNQNKKIEARYDGIVVFPIIDDFKGSDLDWFQTVGVPKNVMKFFLNDKIHFLEAKRYHNLKVLPYKLSPDLSHDDIPHNMGVTYSLREEEKYINSIVLPHGSSTLLPGIGNRENLIIWDFGKHIEWPRRIGIFFEERPFNEAEKIISTRLESHLLRLTFPSQDNFFDQLFIGNLRMTIFGTHTTKTIKFSSALGDPLIKDFEVKYKYIDDFYDANLDGIGEIPFMTTPLRRSIRWPCSEEIVRIELSIEDLLIMRRRSLITDVDKRNQKEVILLDERYRSLDCS